MSFLGKDRVIAGNSTPDYNHFDIFKNLKRRQF